MNEPGLDLSVEEVDQRREESTHVEQAAGLAVQPERGPAPGALRACIESTN
jgi:hypothetical protein